MGKTLKNYTDYILAKNMQVYNYYHSYFKNLVISRFTWSIDESISRYIETTLYRNGFLIACKINGVFLFTKAVALGYNHYGDAISFRTISELSMFNNINVPIDDCVVIYNNKIKTPSYLVCSEYAQKIDGIEKLITQNREQQKIPFFVVAPEGQKLNMEKIMQKTLNGDIYVLMHEDISALGCKIDIAETRVKNNLLDYAQFKRVIISDFLTEIGINNIGIQKKERLITGESDENNELILINRNSFLEPRKKACIEIKEKFGLDINVEYSITEKEMII